MPIPWTALATSATEHNFKHAHTRTEILKKHNQSSCHSKSLEKPVMQYSRSSENLKVRKQFEKLETEAVRRI